MPSGYTNAAITAANISITWNGTNYQTDFDPNSLKPACQAMEYASLSGNNNNDGQTSITPVRSLRLASALGNLAVTNSGGTITGYCVEAVPGEYRATNTQARSGQPSLNGTYQDALGSGTVPNASVVLESTTTSPVYSIMDVALGSFTSSSCTNVYKYNYTGTSVTSTVTDKTNIDAAGVPVRLVPVLTVADPNNPCAEIAAQVTAFPGHGVAYNDSSGKFLWVETFDNRSPDSNIVDINGTGLASPNSAAPTMWINHWQFWGTETNLGASVPSGTFTLVVQNSAFLNSGSDQFGVLSNGKMLVYVVDSIAAYGNLDGWNYHCKAGSVDSSTCPSIIEIGTSFGKMVGEWNGWGGGGANNGSTVHEFTEIARVNGEYTNNEDRSIHDINNALSLNMGSLSGPSWANATVPIGNWVSGVSNSDHTQMWLDRCVSAPGDTYDFYVYSASSLKYANMSLLAYSLGGTTANITPYSASAALPKVFPYAANDNDMDVVRIAG